MDEIDELLEFYMEMYMSDGENEKKDESDGDEDEKMEAERIRTFLKKGKKDWEFKVEIMPPIKGKKKY
jgi:hypothetical protein